MSDDKRADEQPEQSPWDPPEDLADEWRQWAGQTERPF